MRTDNIEILQDTLDILERGTYKAEGQTVALKLTRLEQHASTVLLPEEVRHICDEMTTEVLTDNVSKQICCCVNEDSYAAAIELQRQHPEERVLVLNFANPVNPGGGVRHGANAQEEDLCRKSSLLLSLEDEQAMSYYDYNDSLHTNMGSDAIILSPQVEIIKDSTGKMLEDSVIVSVLTCAAPMIIYGTEGMTEVEYEAMLYDRIKGILGVSAHYGYKYLVLGAWGCGAFGNDAQVIARLFHKALEDVECNTQDGLFKEIYFAVLDRTRDQYNYRAFMQYFGGRL